MRFENNRENKSENKETFAEGRKREDCAQNHSQDFEQKALLYAYGELPAEEEKDFLLHLNGCEACQRVLFVSSAARASLGEVKVPEVCLERILQRAALLDAAKDAAKTSAAKKHSFAVWLRWAFRGGAGAHLRPAPAVRLTSFAAVFAAAVFIFAGVFFYKGGYGGTKDIYAVSVSQQDFLNSMYDNLDSIETEVEGLETYISQFQ